MKTENNIQSIAIFCILLALLIGMPFMTEAADLNDSVLEIPEGTVFKLRHELEIPANQDYIILGQSVLDEGFNALHQTLNSNDSRLYGYSGHTGGYHHFTDYHSDLFEGFDRTYRKCRERHRQYYSVETPANDNVIVNQGSGNTNIIVNNNPGGGTTTGSYIGANSCAKPDHTVTALLIDSDTSGQGGAFRAGHEFKVKSVHKKTTRSYDILMIYFDHDVATGIAIVTTHPLKDIAIHQLQYSEQEGSKGFWTGLMDVLGGIQNIAGIHFDVNLPEGKHYFD